MTDAAAPVPALDERMQALESAARQATLTWTDGAVPQCALVLHPDRLDVRAEPARPGHGPYVPSRRVVQEVGALVLALRAALAERGWAAEVDRLPRPEDPELLAVVRPADGDPEPGLDRLAGTPPAPRVRRREAGARPLPAELLEQARAAAAAEGARLLVLDTEADRRLVVELHRDARAVRGPVPGEPEPGCGDTFLLLVTADDDEPAWLRSGQAVERVLVTLAHGGRSGTPVPGVLDVPLTRDRARSALCWDDHPQALLRVA